jgi:hypothetical protein
MNVIRITSKQDGFRRAGIAHPAGPVDHPAEEISAEQLEILRAEPMLVVQELELPDEGDGGKPKSKDAKWAIGRRRGDVC